MPVRSIPGLSIAVDEAAGTVTLGRDVFKLAPPLDPEEPLTVRQLRERIRFIDGRKLTLQTVAKITDLHESSVKNYEYGASKINLPLRTLAIYQTLLQVDTGDLWAASELSRVMNSAPDTRVHDPEPGKRRRNKII
jgi:hypothetical protein